MFEFFCFYGFIVFNSVCIYTKFELQYLSMLLTQKSEKSSVSSLGGEYTYNKYTIENLKRHRFLLLPAGSCAFFVLNNFFYKERFL